MRREVAWLQGPRPTHYPHREHDDRAQQSEHAVDGNAQDPERDQEDPHERVDNQRQQRERPAEHEQDTPQQELHHTWQYDLPSNRFIDPFEGMVRPTLSCGSARVYYAADPGRK
jgi:hypothetical protein